MRGRVATTTTLPSAQTKDFSSRVLLPQLRPSWRASETKWPVEAYSKPEIWPSPGFATGFRRGASNQKMLPEVAANEILSVPWRVVGLLHFSSSEPGRN
jgi:hypothetical protein